MFLRKLCLSNLVRAWRWCLTIGLVWGVQVTPCWAQVGEPQQETKNYVPVYMIIVLLTMLALMIICKSATRDDRVRKEN